jgi:integrase
MASSSRYSLNKNKYLLEPELSRLEEILFTYKDKNSRDCLLLFLALKTGARAQEILNLTREDVNTYDQCLLIRGIKNSNDREIPLPKPIFHLLEAYLKVQGIHELHAKLFPITYNRFRQIWEFYRPTHKKLHSLRHTFAIQLYKKTKDIRLVQFALGHRNITNTMIYADYMYSRDELRKFLL